MATTPCEDKTCKLWSTVLQKNTNDVRGCTKVKSGIVYGTWIPKSDK